MILFLVSHCFSFNYTIITTSYFPLTIFGIHHEQLGGNYLTDGSNALGIHEQGGIGADT